MVDLYGYIAPYLYKKNEIISISGPSASGKTTLALQLIGEFINSINEEKVIWIQASEHFPKRRINSLLSGNIVQKAYVLKHTYVIPPTFVLSSFEELTDVLAKLSTQDLPIGIKFMVIDNISHHLRYHLSQYGEISEKSKIVNTFFDKVLFPLIMRCFRQEIHLILIHEVSQDVKTGRTRPFYYKLFNRIKCLSITFSGLTHIGNQMITVENAMECIHEGSYEISQSGIKLR